MRNIHFENYKPAPVSLLTLAPMKKEDPDLQRKLKENAQKLEDVLKSFGINAQVVDIQHGASVTRFELTVERGTRLQRISHIQDEIMLELAVFSLRVEAPVPGKSVVGIEIPNDEHEWIYLRELVESDEFRYSSPLTVPVGRDISGNEIYCDLAKMPNLLVAGTIASGKSIWIYSMLISILVHSSPEDVRMILIDPKVVDLSVYNGIPHLIRPVITDHEKAVCALKWTIAEMQRRYRLFEAGGVRDIRQYNKKNKDDPKAEHLPQILIVIDELAELKSSYSDLAVKFDSVKATYYAGSNDDIQTYNDARIELTRADSAIENVQSALDAGKPSNEVDSRIDFAKQKLNDANEAYNNL